MCVFNKLIKLTLPTFSLLPIGKHFSLLPIGKHELSIYAHESVPSNYKSLLCIDSVQITDLQPPIYCKTLLKYGRAKEYA